MHKKPAADSPAKTAARSPRGSAAKVSAAKTSAAKVSLAKTSLAKTSLAKAKPRAPFSRPDLSTPARRPNQAEIAYERLKAAIVTLMIAPNTPLNEAMICNELGLGRTPVHQACHRLALEGLVQIVPRKGMLVPPLSMDDFLDLVAARRVNEPACAALAAERMTDTEIKALAALVADSRRLPRDDLATLIALDQRFHEGVAAGARNRVFAGIVKNLNDRSARFWALSLSNDAHRAETIEEHERIVAALAERDAERAAQAMSDHIDSFARTFTRLA